MASSGSILPKATDHPNGKLTVQAVVTPSRDAMIKEVFAQRQTVCRRVKSLAHKEN